MGNLADFDDRTDAVTDWNALEPIDQWAMVRLQQLLAEIEGEYDEYKYHALYRTVYDYVVNDLSAIYLDATKDRVYSEAAASVRRRACQTVCMNILEVLVRVLTPIISFTTEEVWQHYPAAIRNRADRPVSVQLAGWPQAADFVPALPADAHAVADDFDVILQVREAATKALEDARNAKTIGKSQEAVLNITLPDDMLAVVKRYDDAVFEELFIVNAVVFAAGDELAVSVSPTSQERCPRCWNHRVLGGNAAYPQVCERCGDVLAGIGYVEE